jgi:hypothetical protein
MSKELVLIPKRKYEELLQPRMDKPQHGEGLKTDDQTNISAQKLNDDLSAQKSKMKSHVSEENKSIDKEDNKFRENKLSSYVKMNPATFAEKSENGQKRKWLTFNI